MGNGPDLPTKWIPSYRLLRILALWTSDSSITIYMQNISLNTYLLLNWRKFRNAEIRSTEQFIGILSNCIVFAESRQQFRYQSRPKKEHAQLREWVLFHHSGHSAVVYAAGATATPLAHTFLTFLALLTLIVGSPPTSKRSARLPTAIAPRSEKP